MQPNNTFFVKTTEEEFYRDWVEILTPFHHLTAREQDVAARILSFYFKFREAGIDDTEVLRDLLWSRKTRKDMMESLKMQSAHFQMVLARLREVQFLVDGDINPRFIPHKTSEPRLMLAVYFDWSSRANPINGGK